MIRIILPYHLRLLAKVSGEVTLDVAGPATQRSVLDALEARFPALCGTLRDQVAHERRPFVRFFAEHGFEGQTRELARRAGITHPLLYRYFPTKDALIERVYKEVYLNRWQREWEVLLKNPDQELEERLVAFYQAYLTTIDRYDWVRIIVYAGLKDVSITKRFLGFLQKKVIEPIGFEIRRVAGDGDAIHVNSNGGGLIDGAWEDVKDADVVLDRCVVRIGFGIKVWLKRHGWRNLELGEVGRAGAYDGDDIDAERRRQEAPSLLIERKRIIAGIGDNGNVIVSRIQWNGVDRPAGQVERRPDQAALI